MVGRFILFLCKFNAHGGQVYSVLCKVNAHGGQV